MFGIGIVFPIITLRLEIYFYPYHIWGEGGGQIEPMFDTALVMDKYLKSQFKIKEKIHQSVGENRYMAQSAPPPYYKYGIFTPYDKG